MNKNKYNTVTSLQAKTLKLKKYSDKIKLLYSLSKNNSPIAITPLASHNVRNGEETIGIRGGGEESKLNYSNQALLIDRSTMGYKDITSAPILLKSGASVAVGRENLDSTNIKLSLLSGKTTWKNHPKIQAIYRQKEQLEQEQQKLDRQSSVFFSSTSLPTNTNPSLPAVRNGGMDRKEVQLRSGKRAFIKTPLVRISSRLHKHIKSLSPSLWIAPMNRFNSEVANNSTITYNFNNNFKKFKLTSILENSLFSMDRLISKPVLNIKPNKVIINLFFYLSPSSKASFNLSPEVQLTNLLKSKSQQLQALCAFLSKKFKKPIELELVRLHHPSLESNILANTIGYIAKNTRKTFRVIMLKLFKSTKIKKFNEFKYIYNIRNFKPTALGGIRIKLGGRLLSQRIVPRFTSRTIQRGNLGKTKADFISTSRFTSKNKRGAFSFTITMGHKFF